MSSAETLAYGRETISAEGQFYAYEALLGYESDMAKMVEADGTYDAAYTQFNQASQQKWGTIMDGLEGTDYTYIFAHGYDPRYSRDDMDQLLYGALIDGYDPLARVSSGESDFMWDEILDLRQEHPRIVAILDKYASSNFANLPIEDYSTHGFVIPRAEMRRVLGSLYDEGVIYRRIFGYPYISDPIPATRELDEERDIAKLATITVEGA